MNIKNLMGLLIFAFFEYNHAMEKPNELIKHDKKKITAYFKKISKIPEKDAIVPQGIVKNNMIYLNLKSEELFTQFTFEEIIREQTKKKLPFILAMVKTCGIENKKSIINFYEAVRLNMQLSNNLLLKDSINKQLIESLCYFSLDSLKKRFEYLGSYKDENIDKIHFINAYFRAVTLNDPESQCYVGLSYAEGVGIDQSNKKLFYWYKKAADQNYKKAQLILGFMYLNGSYGVEQDYAKGCYLLEKAKKH